MKNDTRTSLEKSHSLWSNAKLTLFCTLGSLGFAGFFAVLGLANRLETKYLVGALTVSLLLACGSLFLLRNFKR